MLRLIYKTLLVSVLSLSLLLLDFNYKGLMLNSSHAQGVKIENEQGQAKKSDKDVEAALTKSVTGSVSEVARTEKIDDQDLIGTLTMMVIAVLAKRLYTYKPTTDLLLAAAAGTIFLAGEILAFFKLKKAMKGMEEEITRDKEGKINSEQVASLERLKRSYEDAKKTAGTKKNLQIAAAAAFVAAGIAAFSLDVVDKTTLIACTGGISTGLAAGSAVGGVCAGLSASITGSAAGAACYTELAACTSAITLYSAAIMKYELSRQAYSPSSVSIATTTALGAALTAQLSSLPAACGLYTKSMGIPVMHCSELVPVNYIAMSGGVGLSTPLTANNILKDLPSIYKQEFLRQGISERQIISAIEKYSPTPISIMLKALDLFFPQAKAGILSSMGIASAVVVSYILATSATIGPAIDMFMLIPQKRAIVWGILAALTGVATTSTDNVIDQIDSNIRKIDAILNSMYALNDGTNTSNTPNVIGNKAKAKQDFVKPGLNPGANAVNYEDIDLSNGINGTLPCGTGENDKTCKPFEAGLKDLPSFAGLNGDSQLQLSSILKTASGLSGTSKISASTLKGVANLAGQSNALKAALAKAKADAAAKLKKAGSKFNIDSESKKLSGQMEKSIRANLKKNNTNAAGMLASFSGGKFGGGSDSSSSGASDVADKKTESGVQASGGLDANVINLNDGTSDKMDLGLTGLETGADGKMSAEELAAFNAAAAAKKAEGSMDDYEIKNDISKDTDANIFELISHRYLQSGYPRLFKLKESPTAEPVKN